MKNALLIALLASNTNKTHNLRTFAGYWMTRGETIPDEVATQIGKVIALLQAKIDQGLICNKNTEGLIVYDLEPALCEDNSNLYCLQTVLKTLSELNETHQIADFPIIQFIINRDTTEIWNNAKALLELGIMSMQQLHKEGIEPVVYGKYIDFEAVCGVVAMECKDPLDIRKVFSGDYDDSDTFKQAVAFNCYKEAEIYLSSFQGMEKYIGELITCKESYSQLLSEGIGKNLIKIVDCKRKRIAVTFNAQTRCKEADIEYSTEVLFSALREF